MKQIAIIGTGYVGLTTGVGLAHLGHQVVCADVDEEKVARLRRGESPILEEGLEELLLDGLSSGRLSFVVGAAAAVRHCDVAFMCVPTPQGTDGSVDLTFLDAAAIEVGPLLPSGAVVVNKSTVPVGTADRVRRTIRRADVFVVSNPEFLREGTAVSDFFRPARIVIGSDHKDAAERVASLYANLDAPVILTDAASAETIKYASNAFLATKLSFVNAIASFCEAVGADMTQVALGMGSDPRIGSQFLKPGPGWGGSCFPKDTTALLRMSTDAGLDFNLLTSVVESNERQLDRVTDKVEAAAGGTLDGRTVALWGLTFKAGTDDLRCSPALAVAERLRQRGATLQAFDPAVGVPLPGIQVTGDPYSACRDADVLAVLTEWPEFGDLDLAKVRELLNTPAIVDTRNILNADIAESLGFRYDAVGRPSPTLAGVLDMRALQPTGSEEDGFDAVPNVLPERDVPARSGGLLTVLSLCRRAA
jgi:UDPglucose 6-dehydrogenase